MYAADTRHNNTALADKLARIYTLKGGSKIDLTIRPPYLDLLEKLGNPDKTMPPAIHVAGTNGKGSTIAFLKAILNAAGYRVHAYTSPHLHQFNERITLADQHIDDIMLETLLDEVMTVNKGEGLTFFEVTTAIAFLAFSRVQADIVLLETGLGGRLDCTNVIENPLATIITNIGFDHTEFLGNTITAIAGEKAGILKKDRPCILGAQIHNEAAQIIELKANILNASVIKTKTQWPATLPAPSLKGPHQFDNAQNALAALPILNDNGFKITEGAVMAGLQAAYWPARLQHIENITPYEVWYDGGHNEDAARILAVQAAIWQKEDDKPLYLVIAMMRTKDPVAFTKTLQPYIKGIICTAVPDEPACFSPQDLAKTLKIAGLPITDTIEDIKNLDILNLEDNARVLICGSLYLAAYFPK